MARAGYRFVPFDNMSPPRIVEPPISFDDLKLDEPNREGSVSGTLEATWVAETPVCIGVKDQNGVEPLEIDGRGCLPGASLRGMVRSVMEIAGFCHLGPINDHRHFGFRDFNDADNYTPRVGDIRAGWLTYDDGWKLAVAGDGSFALVPFRNILTRMGTCAPSEADWRKLEIHDKRLRLANCKPSLLGRQEETIENIRKSRYLVVGGATTDPGATRAHEVWISPPSELDNRIHTLHDDFMSLFNRINANPGRDTPEPTGAWRYWLGQKAPGSPQATWCKPRSTDPPPLAACQLPGIPVFFCGDPKKATEPGFETKTSTFVMGLSRFIKIPYRESVGDVAGRLYCPVDARYARYRVSGLRENFDLARAIFGWVDDAKDGDAAVQALAGRVAFSPAFSCANPSKTGPTTFVFGPPRESFYPFYLEGNYHGKGGMPVGRKRYPVRSQPNYPNIPNANVDTQSSVLFHACGTSYTGRIRVHNLHPVELAAFVWSLTFGEFNGSWHHAIGRAKGFGYGRLRLDRLAWARQPKIIANCGSENCDAPATKSEWDTLAKKFEEWMSEQLGCEFAKTKTISRLRAYANPELGDRNSQNLAYPEVEEFRNIAQRVDDGENWEL